MKTLSIVIVSWNAKKFVDECLESLRAFSSKADVEIFVVDNASTDGTAELVRDSYSEVTLIRNDHNAGFARANNIAIARSAGKYVALVNSDVRVLDGCLEKMIEFMDSHPKVGVSGPRMIGPAGVSARSYMSAPTLWRCFCRALALDVIFPNSKVLGSYTMPYFKRDQTAEVDILNGWFWMTRREALDQVGLLDETFFMYGEDIDWCKRFHDAGWGVVYFPEAESIHYGGASSARAPVRFYIEMQRANLQYWKKHFSRFSQFAFVGIVLLHEALRLSVNGPLLAARSTRADASYKVKRSIACLRWIMGFEERERAQAQ
ncbi:MAG: glycosyltransferase family 2 protein [Acidobacteriota bacterium]|nr:glycosyltransferase family 2 protein [Acidobacteriota bacterium]